MPHERNTHILYNLYNMMRDIFINNIYVYTTLCTNIGKIKLLKI